MKILHVVGARPDFVEAAPVMLFGYDTSPPAGSAGAALKRYCPRDALRVRYEPADWAP